MEAGIWGGGSKGKKQLGRSRFRYENNIKMGLQTSLRWHGRDHLATYSDKWEAYVEVVINFWFL
jgi:hypothetical protein